MPTLASGDPQARGDQPPHERMAVDMLRAGGDEPLEGLFGDVVMVEVEAATRDAVGRGEGVELVETGVADQVRPQAAVRRPARVVDQDGHGPESRLAVNAQGPRGPSRLALRGRGRIR